MRIERRNRIKCELMWMLSANKCVLGLFTFLCVLFNTYTCTHTHTHRARASGRETSPVALSFFDGSFPLPSLSLLRFSTAPPKNTTQSFLFFSFHFASRSEPSLTLKLTHPENVKSVFRFSGFVSLLFLLSFFFFW